MGNQKDPHLKKQKQNSAEGPESTMDLNEQTFMIKTTTKLRHSFIMWRKRRWRDGEVMKIREELREMEIGMQRSNIHPAFTQKTRERKKKDKCCQAEEGFQNIKRL